MSVSPAVRHEDQTTQSSNAALIAAGYEAFARGDIPTVLEMFADDISWRVSGRSPLAGTYTGHDEVLDFIGLLGQLSNGTFRMDVHAVLGDSEHVAVIVTEHAERNGTHASLELVHVWHVENGKAMRFQAYVYDEYAIDAFWSS